MKNILYIFFVCVALNSAATEPIRVDTTDYANFISSDDLCNQKIKTISFTNNDSVVYHLFCEQDTDFVLNDNSFRRLVFASPQKGGRRIIPLWGEVNLQGWYSFWHAVKILRPNDKFQFVFYSDKDFCVNDFKKYVRLFPLSEDFYNEYNSGDIKAMLEPSSDHIRYPYFKDDFIVLPAEVFLNPQPLPSEY